MSEKNFCQISPNFCWKLPKWIFITYDSLWPILSGWDVKKHFFEKSGQLIFDSKWPFQLWQRTPNFLLENSQLSSRLDWAMPRTSYFSHFYGREIRMVTSWVFSWKTDWLLEIFWYMYWKCSKTHFFLKDDPFCTNYYAGDLV